MKANLSSLTLGETGDLEATILTLPATEWGDETPVPGRGPQAGFNFAQKYEQGEEFVPFLNLIQLFIWYFLSIKRL